jgi:hypothetical protein
LGRVEVVKLSSTLPSMGWISAYPGISARPGILTGISVVPVFRAEPQIAIPKFSMSAAATMHSSRKR